MILKKIKSKVYLILPIFSLVFWALFFLSGFIGFDFMAYYYAGKNIFTNPEIIYTNQIHPRYLYCPGFASVFSIISMFEFSEALFLYKLILLLFAIASLIIMDDILTIKKVDIKLKISILLALNCGFGVYRIFSLLQSKYIVIFLILLFIRREITNEKYTLRFFASQSLILVLVISILPYTVFIALIYLFHHSKKYFSTKQIKKILIIIIEFFLFNFMFILKPLLIFAFLKGFLSISYHLNLTTAPLNINTIITNGLTFRRSISVIILYLIEIYTGLEVLTFFSMIITIIVLSIASYRNIKSTKKIEAKIGNFFLIFLLFSGTYYHAHFVVLLSLVSLLFTDKSKWNYLAILCIGILFVFPPANEILKDFHLLTLLPAILYVIFPSILYIVIAVCYYKKGGKN